MVDKIKGGLADSKSLQDIADKHKVTLSAIESALADGIKIEQEHTTDAKVAEEIAKDHLFEDAEYYTKLKTIEKTNSKDWAKTYKASNFIEKGVCTYNDETIYFSQECLNKAIASIKGRPVVIKHQKVDPSNMQDHAVGYVSGCGFSEWDASFYCDFLVFDDEGKEVIAKDYSVSCAYIPKVFGIGGTWHNTPYDREVTELEFTHLALVPDPRYEDAKIYENAKGEDMEIHNEAGHWITVHPKGHEKGQPLLVKDGESNKDAIDRKFDSQVKEKKEVKEHKYSKLFHGTNVDLKDVKNPAEANKRSALGKAFYLSFDEETNAFESFLSYHPENMCALGTQFISWKDGELYTHDNSQYNFFHGVQYDSTITLVFNVQGLEKKTWESITEVANTIFDCPVIYTNSESFAGQRQETNLSESNFKVYEGNPSAAILRDINSRKGRINGDTMKGNYIAIKFRKQNASNLIYLSIVSVKYIDSPLTSK